MIDMTTTHEMAKIFIARYGDEAVLQVNRREKQARQSGMDAEADDWHRVRQVLEVSKGPPVS